MKTCICFVHKSSMFRKSTSFDYLCTCASVVPSLLLGCVKIVDQICSTFANFDRLEFF
jgi:hypothetical protein